MDLVKLADYHLWANDRVRGIIQDLTREEYEKEVIPPCKNILGLVIHSILAVEYNIWARVKEEKIDPYDIGDRIASMSIEEACTHWRNVDLALVEFASTHLDLKATFPNFLKEGEMIVDHDDFFMQYMVHTAYHRSQIMSAMRMLGKEGIGTDYLFYLSSLT
jgi:uncharacterized damage-inducible protein DinB